MASGSSRRASQPALPKYVYDLPYLPLRQLSRILDDNNQWKNLGGIYMQYDVTTLNEFGRTRSPTESMLSNWGQKNHTVNELFVLLSRMQHYRALEVLLPYVDRKLHPLYEKGELNMSALLLSESGASATPATGKQQQVNPENLPTPQEHQCGAKSTIDSCNLNSPNQDRVLPCKVSAFHLSPAVRGEQCSQPIAISSTTRSDNNAGGSWNTPPANNRQPVSPVASPANANQQHRRDSESSAFSDVSSASAMSNIPPIDEAELAVATNQWSGSSVLGRGGFGTVYKGMWKNTHVAIKRMENKGLAATNIVAMRQSFIELKILNAVRHDNILPIYGYSLDGDYPCLVYQFMPNGSLEDHLLVRHGNGPLNWERRLNTARGTACGLQFLHTTHRGRPLIHGDIKSANILLDKNFEPKIGDFGLARELPQTLNTHIVSRVHGTRPYLPDEYLRSKKISTKVDTYSFGIVLFELGTGLRAYDNQRPDAYLRDHVENCDLDALQDLQAGHVCSALYKPLMKIGLDCAALQARDRPEMVEVLKKLDDLSVQTEQYMMRLHNAMTSAGSPVAPPSVTPPAASSVPDTTAVASESVSLIPQMTLLDQVESGAVEQSVAYESANLPAFTQLISDENPSPVADLVDLSSLIVGRDSDIQESEKIQNDNSRSGICVSSGDDPAECSASSISTRDKSLTIFTR